MHPDIETHEYSDRDKLIYECKEEKFKQSVLYYILFSISIEHF